MKKLLLCTDLDRTLIPNGPHPESKSAREIFNNFTLHSDVTLVYVSGRDKLLIQEAIKKYNLPTPDFVIADVGSTIYQVTNNSWVHMDDWDSEISGDWNGKNNEELQDILHRFSELRIQEYSKQNKYKLSYYVPLQVEHVVLLDKIYSSLKSKGIKVNLIWSVDINTDLGLLDILPASANKQHAIEFIMNRFDFDLTDTIYAGDSGNDIAVINSSINSILVANAEEDIIHSAMKHAKESNQLHSFYLAKGDFFGMNGNYSAGVLEGVVHYMPDYNKFIKLTENGISNE